MSQMINLASTFQTNEWFHSRHFALTCQNYELTRCQQTRFYRRFTHTSLVKKTHQERLSMIDHWLQSTNKMNNSEFATNALPDTVSQIVIENAYWKVVIPSVPASRYESLIVPKRPCTQLSTLSYAQKTTLAALLGRLATRYDNLLMTSLDCEICWYQSSDSDIPLFATYLPTNNKRVEAPVDCVGMKKTISAQTFAHQLNLLSDIHFEDIFLV